MGVRSTPLDAALRGRRHSRLACGLVWVQINLRQQRGVDGKAGHKAAKQQRVLRQLQRGEDAHGVAGSRKACSQRRPAARAAAARVKQQLRDQRASHAYRGRQLQRRQRPWRQAPQASHAEARIHGAAHCERGCAKPPLQVRYEHQDGGALRAGRASGPGSRRADRPRRRGPVPQTDKARPMRAAAMPRGAAPGALRACTAKLSVSAYVVSGKPLLALYMTPAVKPADCSAHVLRAMPCALRVRTRRSTIGEYSSSEPAPMAAPSSDASVCKSVCDTAATAAAGAATTAARGERAGARPRSGARHGLRSAANPARPHGDACCPRRRAGVCDEAAAQRDRADGAGAPQRGSSRAVRPAIAPGAAS